MEQLLLNHNIEFPHWFQCLYPSSAPCWVRNLLSSCICNWRSSSCGLSVCLSEQSVLRGWTCSQSKEMIPGFFNHRITFPAPILNVVSIFWTPPCLWNYLCRFIWSNSKKPARMPVFHVSQTGVFPDVLDKLAKRAEPQASHPCVVPLITQHITSFSWVHTGKVPGWTWIWLEVQLTLVEIIPSWPSWALAGVQTHDVHTSLMQPLALELCKAGSGKMSGNAE